MRIVARSQPGVAGIYSRNPRRIAGSAVTFPNPAEIPRLMEEFGAWLRSTPAEPFGAFEAHFRLTAIHPFADGNDRTARLLMLHDRFARHSPPSFSPLAGRGEMRRIDHPEIV